MLFACACLRLNQPFVSEEIMLTGLKTPQMNGKRGVARGFLALAERSRRAVYLIDDQNEIAVKPEKIRLIGTATSTSDASRQQ
jgi:hypothetical protein